MKLNSSSAFSYAASGKLTEEMAADYDRVLSERFSKYRNVGGWLGDKIRVAEETHRHYIDSGMWDYANIIRGSNGVYVGYHDIGYLGTLSAQRGASGLMCKVISANPLVRELIKDERIVGYNGYQEFTEEEKIYWGRELDYYYAKLTDGVAQVKDKELVVRYFSTSRDEHTHYAKRERAEAMKTWRMSNRFVKNGFDPTSIGTVLSKEDVEKKHNEIKDELDDLSLSLILLNSKRCRKKEDEAGTQEK